MRETQYIAIQRNDNRVEQQAGCQNGNQHTAQGVPELLAKLRNDVAVDDKNTLKKPADPPALLGNGTST